MIDKEKIVNRIMHLTEKMKNEENTFLKHQYFVEIKNLEEGLKRLEEENLTDNRMDFEQFEMIFNTSKDLINCVQKLFRLSENLDSLPGYLFAEVCRLHNAAVDFTEAYTRYLENKEV